MNKNLINKILIVLLVLSGVGTLAVGVFYAIEPEMASLPIRLIFLFLLSADAVCYFVAAWGVCRNIKWVYPLTIALLVVNAVGLIFDDIGTIDIAVAIFNILLLILLIYNQRGLNDRAKKRLENL